MRGFGTVPDDLLGAAELALEEGRLHWRVTDARGRPCNGGEADPLPIGEWSPEREPVIYRSGWHLTDEPHRWCGQRVWLCEGRGGGEREQDKTVWAQVRPLAEVDPATCLDASARMRAGGTDAPGADLRGANLRGAYLREANLREANLRRANLYRADLCRANLRGVDLRGVDLRGVDLRGADLRGTDLRGTNLSRADLYRADLSRADLCRADLRGVDLSRADLSGADLRGAIGVPDEIGERAKRRNNSARRPRIDR